MYITSSIPQSFIFISAQIKIVMAGEKAMAGSTTRRWMVVMVVPLLRVLAMFATAAATIVMTLNKETHTFVVATIGNDPVKVTLMAKFQHTPANV